MDAKPRWPQPEEGHPLRRGLLLDYVFADGGGSRLVDFGPLAHHATTDRGWSRGVSGSLQTFDKGAWWSQCVTCGTAVKPTGPDCTLEVICTWDGQGSGEWLRTWVWPSSDAEDWLSISKTSGQKLRFKFNETVSSTTTIISGTRYHVIGRRRGRAYAIWVNGAQEATSTGTSDAWDGFGYDQLRIGRHSSSSAANHWSGTIELARMWGVALQDHAIESLFNDPWAMEWPRRRVYAGVAASATSKYLMMV